MTNADQPFESPEQSAEEFEAIVATAEAGVADVMAVYETAEASYFAAVSQMHRPLANAAYSTHT
jgi:hypothetical protein